MSVESSKTGTKERIPDGLSLPNQNTILINRIYYFKRYGKSRMKFNSQKTNKMDLNNNNNIP